MDYTNDFVDETEEEEIEVLGRKFKFKPTSGGTEVKWFKQYMKLDQESGEIVCDHEILNSLKLKRVTAVPYGKDIINKQIGIDKEFNELTETQRISFLNKLHKDIYNGLTKKMDKFQSGDETKKKSCETK
jgi:hypothetical protein